MPSDAVESKLPVVRVVPPTKPVALSLLIGAFLAATAVAQTPQAVSALGRLEPLHGVIRVTAPVSPEATAGMVLHELHVEPGDDVRRGQLIAVTETAPLLRARVAEARSQVLLAERRTEAAAGVADADCVQASSYRREADRRTSLLTNNLSSVEETERATGEADFREARCLAATLAVEASKAEIELAAAGLTRSQAALDRSQVHSPVDGRVLAVNTRPGELIQADGIVEIGQVWRMYAIAEVYETDVARIRIGQPAEISSRALAEPMTGTVEHIRLQVRKQDQLGTDPAARKDARIVEVEVLLDDPESVAGLSHMQVNVVINP